jgi:hypothetical protein
MKLNSNTTCTKDCTLRLWIYILDYGRQTRRFGSDLSLIGFCGRMECCGVEFAESVGDLDTVEFRVAGQALSARTTALPMPGLAESRL